ncbi:hypothetical protein KKH27_01940 [bacterium]|nr:hypothetical protein [bacterium]MBU1985340.1 hypothetical protein [bacterium]
MRANLGWFTVVLMIGLASVAWAADNDNHQVTVTVEAINELAITGGNITLTINTATAGSDPDAVQDATCGLLWTVNTTNKKITVATNQASFDHTLLVVATGVSGGTAEPAVTLTNLAQDLVTAVAETLGSCTLEYTASATAAQGTQSVAHTITYTITAAS